MITRATSVAIAVLFVMLGANIASAQPAVTLKLGIVDSETIIKQLPEAADAEKKLTETGKKFRDTLELMQTDLGDKFKKYQAGEAMMTADAKRKEQEILQGLQQRLLAYQEEKKNELGRMQEQMLIPIREKVSAAIAAVAKEEKVNFVLDKANPALVYAEDKFDLTFKVLDRLKRGR